MKNIVGHNLYQKPQPYELQFLRYGVRQSFFVMLSYFLLFDPPSNKKNQNFEKIKKP